MEDRNPELNAEEMAQGVGGVQGQGVSVKEIEERIMREVLMWKKMGKTKAEYLADHQRGPL